MMSATIRFVCFWGRSVPCTGFPVGICWNASWKGADSIRPAEACEPAPEQLLRLLDYRDDRCRILFENIKLERTDSAVVIQGMAINAVLMR